MAFGKRPLTSVAAAAAKSTVSLPAALSEPASSEERHIAFRDMMQRILRDTSLVADAVRNNGTVPISGIADELDAMASPIPLRDLPEQFSFADGGLILHPYFGYATADRPDQIDPSAQFHLLDLVSRVRELNVFCQDGNQNDALGVALQSPKLPALVDSILVASAFFAAYFENLATTQVFITGASAQTRQLPDFNRLKIIFDRYQLMAQDRMLAPELIGDLIPFRAWPHLGVEILRRHETGEQFVHGVYFPASYARQLIERAGRTPQASAMTTV